jgi:hypothetical protein
MNETGCRKMTNNAATPPVGLSSFLDGSGDILASAKEFYSNACPLIPLATVCLHSLYRVVIQIPELAGCMYPPAVSLLCVIPALIGAHCLIAATMLKNTPTLVMGVILQYLLTAMSMVSIWGYNQCGRYDSGVLRLLVFLAMPVCLLFTSNLICVIITRLLMMIFCPVSANEQADLRMQLLCGCRDVYRKQELLIIPCVAVCFALTWCASLFCLVFVWWVLVGT